MIAILIHYLLLTGGFIFIVIFLCLALFFFAFIFSRGGNGW
jgi:hypothetical protein